MFGFIRMFPFDHVPCYLCNFLAVNIRFWFTKHIVNYIGVNTNINDDPNAKLTDVFYNRIIPQIPPYQVFKFID
jgi:hypothetical protein